MDGGLGRCCTKSTVEAASLAHAVKICATSAAYGAMPASAALTMARSSRANRVRTSSDGSTGSGTHAWGWSFLHTPRGVSHGATSQQHTALTYDEMCVNLPERVRFEGDALQQHGHGIRQELRRHLFLRLHHAARVAPNPNQRSSPKARQERDQGDK